MGLWVLRRCLCRLRLGSSSPIFAVSDASFLAAPPPPLLQSRVATYSTDDTGSAPRTTTDSLTVADNWKKCWEDGRLRWHREEEAAHPKLVAHFNGCLPEAAAARGEGEEDSNSESVVVLVPLCGKSVDLRYLYDLGHTVIGIEAIEQAAEQFFEENDDLPLRKRSLKLPPPHSEKEVQVLEIPGGRLQIFVGDFFDMTPEILGRKSSVAWDRGALVAISQDLRNRYVGTLRKLMKDEDYSILLCTHLYERPDENTSPPHHIDLEEVEHMFGSHCDIEVLENRVASVEPFFEGREDTYDSVFRIKPRST